jgi:phosphoglycerol transferase MdoB-like AlkP superfamily enzyme
MFRKFGLNFIKLFILWILIFDFQRLLFLIHNWNKFEGSSFSEWILAFFYSLKLDLATASALSFLPMLFLFLYLIFPKRVLKYLFLSVLFLEFLFVAMIHCGEINAYGEWNHKLTSRVFMHLSNPDEVVRSADYSMTIWFFVYLIIEMVFSWKLMKRLFAKTLLIQHATHNIRAYFIFPIYLVVLLFFSGISLVLLRGGFQQIPININAAIYSNNPVVNDLSINSLYFFSKSFLLYNRSEIDEFMPKINPKVAKVVVKNMYNFPREHNNYFLEIKKPNIVFVVLESWAAEAIGCLSETKGATPNFDKLASEGVLFTNIYGTSHTSEIGNTSIFSGFPGIPEVSISMQPEKSRKLKSLNQSLKPFSYTSAYLFSGDLKYGNIGGYFMDHGFDVVKDENDFESGLERGKLNFYDKALYQKFLKEINQTKEPFLHCAFTGSTHSPYDIPKTKGQNWTGNEADFMNSMIYADQCLGDFIKRVKKQPWFKNTLFVFVADHSHSSPKVTSPMENEFYRIPLLFWGDVIKKTYQGHKNETIGSQFDIPATLLYQMDIDAKEYIWSRDLMNPKMIPFAFHTIIRGYGFVTPKGQLTYQMQMKKELFNNFSGKHKAFEKQRCNAFLTEVYRYYKNL